eukprot:GILJ01013047.1.p1 GENE.GILJ01013047.1~~GILJ01013047.1.p1  ORF type:complete len:1349 (-),score=259.23 GILJ01013047.1:185-4231(-)
MSASQKRGFISDLTYWYLNGFIRLGASRPLQQTDIPPLEDGDSANELYDRFKKLWDEELKKPDPNLFRTSWTLWGPRFLLSALLATVYTGSQFASPFLIQGLITWLTNYQYYGTGNERDVYGYAVGMLVIPLVGALAMQKSFQHMVKIGVQCRSTFTAAVYRKSLVADSASKQTSSTGQIVNLMSTDAMKVADAAQFSQWLWISPVMIVTCIALLINELGVAALAGFAVMFPLTFLAGVNSKRFVKIDKERTVFSDQRIKLISEAILGIRVLKFYAWEDSFLDMISAVRAKELRLVKRFAITRAISMVLLVIVPSTLTVVTFVVYGALGNEITVAKAYSCLAFFVIMRFPLSLLPFSIANLAQIRVSIPRIQKFLMTGEIDSTDIVREPASETTGSGVQISHAHFTWNAPNTDLATGNLTDINMSVRNGQLVGVVGTVGSGKSSLLAGILGLMRKVSGEVKIQGRVAYCAQQAWIKNATLRDNILFGQPFDAARYQACLYACALEPDIKILPAGDATEIGEKGINLSGGQKQRVSIARAVYADSDIYVFDDSLSAVDAYVSRHIFDHCINGLLKQKTRIMATNQLHFLSSFDQIVVLKDGSIVESGSYATLMTDKAAFQELIQKFVTEEHARKSVDLTDPVAAIVDLAPESIADSMDSPVAERSGSIENHEIDIAMDGQDEKLSVMKTVALDKSGQKGVKDIEMVPLQPVKEKTEAIKGATLIHKEERDTGSVPLSVYAAFGLAFGGTLFVSILFLCYNIESLTTVATDWWLGVWSSSNLPAGAPTSSLSALPIPSFNPTPSIGWFMGIYVAIYGGSALTTLARALLMAIGSIRASHNLHKGLLRNILNTTTTFFDTTPTGRIINRFSGDMTAVDVLLPQSWDSTLSCLVKLVVVIIMICLIFPYLAIAFGPMAIIYYTAQRYYRKTSVEVQRLDNISRSPIYSHFSETLEGTATIAAYGAQQRFILENEKLIDTNNSAQWMAQEIIRWLGLRLEALGILILFLAAILSIVARSTIAPALAGMALTYSLQLSSLMNWFVRMSSEVEARMSCVQRIKHYSTNIPTEPSRIIETNRPPANWPAMGAVSFNNVVLKYRPELDPVLKDVSFTVAGGQKCGVVGRTGSGKSTLMMALFRMVEVHSGSISIDDVVIQNIGLNDLRRKLAIIPQDPVLFSGTLRFNLDPFGEYADSAVWDCLELASLKAHCSKSDKGLDMVVEEGGSNFSVGQRQLLCLARALLRRSRVLVLDEATASVDVESDALIQRTVRTAFKESTVLTIAHRLNTIMDSDVIVVLDHGKVVECGTPSDLLDAGNLFAGMVEKTGKASAQHLRMVAKGVLSVFDAVNSGPCN